jgi:hypothetical protein
MGVKFDGVIEGFEGPFEKLDGLQKPAPGKVTGTAGAGYLMTHAANDSFIAVNRLLKAGEQVSWITSGAHQGAFFVAMGGSTAGWVAKLAADLGLDFEGIASRPTGDAIALKQPRIALADQYGGSMPSGWTRWLLEQFEFPFEVVFPKAVDLGDLSAKYDVIIFPSGVGPSSGEGGGRGSGRGGGGTQQVPAEYEHMQGAYTAAQSFPQLKKFVEGGGTVVAVGRSAMNMAELFDLPVGDHLEEKSPDGEARPLPPEKYYVPGSVLRVAVDNTSPIAHGVTNPVDVFFNNSPVFRLEPAAAMKGVRPVAWFDTPTPLRSGWAYGQGYLEGGVEAIDASVGKGKLYLFGPEITFRGQPHGTFKFLFNALHLASGASSSGATTNNASR